MKAHIERTKTTTQCGRPITEGMVLAVGEKVTPKDTGVCYWCRITWEAWHKKGDE